jgi:hypothetical protein
MSPSWNWRTFVEMVLILEILELPELLGRKISHQNLENNFPLPSFSFITDAKYHQPSAGDNF